MRKKNEIEISFMIDNPTYQELLPFMRKSAVDGAGQFFVLALNQTAPERGHKVLNTADCAFKNEENKLAEKEGAPTLGCQVTIIFKGTAYDIISERFGSEAKKIIAHLFVATGNFIEFLGRPSATSLSRRRKNTVVPPGTMLQ